MNNTTIYEQNNYSQYRRQNQLMVCLHLLITVLINLKKFRIPSYSICPMLQNNNSEFFNYTLGISRLTSFIQHLSFFDMCEKPTLKIIKTSKLLLFFFTKLKTTTVRIFSRNFHEYEDHHIRVITFIQVSKGFDSNIN